VRAIVLVLSGRNEGDSGIGVVNKVAADILRAGGKRATLCFVSVSLLYICNISLS